MFHPISGLAVELFHDGDMRHGGGLRGAMPMLLPWWTPDDIPRPDFLDRAILALYASAAGHHDQGLAQQVGMPGGPGTGFECHACAGRARGIGRLEQRINPCSAGEKLGLSCALRLRTISFNLPFELLYFRLGI